MPEPADSRRLLAGIGLVVAAVACFGALDTTAKAAALAAVPAMTAVWARSFTQLLIVSATLLPRRGLSVLRTRHPRMQIARGALLALCSVIAFVSLAVMPVGEFTAIVLMTPLVLTLVAALRTRERVSPLRWACVIGGFAGALVVVHPTGDGFHWAMLLPLVLVAANTGYQWLTSRLAQIDDPGTMQVWSSLTGTVLSAVLLPLGWRTLSAADWMLLGLMGVFATAGHLLLTLAYRRAPVSVLTPFLYLQIAFATLYGWLVFAHAPDLRAASGIGLIAICGAVGTWLTARETRATRRAQAAPGSTDAG